MNGADITQPKNQPVADTTVSNEFQQPHIQIKLAPINNKARFGNLFINQTHIASTDKNSQQN
jgi:hypothetical protein